MPSGGRRGWALRGKGDSDETGDVGDVGLEPAPAAVPVTEVTETAEPYASGAMTDRDERSV